MAFPPQFLDEIRARLPLSAVIQRRTRLVKKGREWSGLCPFHAEKSPSFTVNDDKGFFHCFGCGAHGDVITFTMRALNLDFLEAVKGLAEEAGLEVPRTGPEEQVRTAHLKTQQDAMTAAAAFFAGQLQTAAAAGARAYLARRGLDREAIARFGLGYAPPSAGQGLLKQALSADFPETMLIELGLVTRKEPDRPSFDYFRDRIMFPILDRTGRVIAFGGRVLGDAKPKYLNSPDTPIFHKGRVLYGLSWARAAMTKKADLIVTEGYMDVIALNRAGFEGAVAPLGTALTEGQLEEIWRLSAEPILCFDGDAAGQRAAARALDRALPLLKAGRSLRFATLPDGEDPDSLIARYGPARMQMVLDQAQPLGETLWRHELAAAPVDTPERKAALEARLKERIALVADEGLRRAYHGFFRTCLFERLRPARSQRGTAYRQKTGFGDKNRFQAPLEWPPPADPGTLDRRRQQVLLAVPLLRPDLLGAMMEDLAMLEFTAPDLDKLCRELLDIHTSEPDLESGALRRRLIDRGFETELTDLMGAQVMLHAGFAELADPEMVMAGWRQALAFWRETTVATEEREAAVAHFVKDDVSGNARLVNLYRDSEYRRHSDAVLDVPGGEKKPS